MKASTILALATSAAMAAAAPADAHASTEKKEPTYENSAADRQCQQWEGKYGIRKGECDWVSKKCFEIHQPKEELINECIYREGVEWAIGSGCSNLHKQYKADETECKNAFRECYKETGHEGTAKVIGDYQTVKSCTKRKLNITDAPADDDNGHASDSDNQKPQQTTGQSEDPSASTQNDQQNGQVETNHGGENVPTPGVKETEQPTKESGKHSDSTQNTSDGIPKAGSTWEEEGKEVCGNKSDKGKCIRQLQKCIWDKYHQKLPAAPIQEDVKELRDCVSKAPNTEDSPDKLVFSS